MTNKTIYHSAGDRTPYVYVIKHFPTSRYYIGVRFAKNCHPSELLTDIGYKTSSKMINEIYISAKDELLIDRITIFDDVKSARAYETKLLKRLKAKSNPTLINFHENETRFPYGSEEFQFLMIKKHGVRNSMFLDSTKEKILATIKIKYNCKSVMLVPEILHKFEYTMMVRHGGKYSLQSPIIKEKINQTNLERYGSIHVLQNPEIKQKVKNTLLEKYGVDNAAKIESVKQNYKRKCIEKYGVDNAAKSESNRIKQSEIERARIAELKSDPEWIILYETATTLRKRNSKSCLGLSKMSKNTLRKEIKSLMPD